MAPRAARARPAEALRRLPLAEAAEFRDQLWHDCKYGALARGRPCYEALAALHAAGPAEAFPGALAAAFAEPMANARDALEHAWGHLKAKAPRAGFEAALARGPGAARAWLFAQAAVHDAGLANSRLLWDDPWPDRAWFGAPLRLGIVDGDHALVVPLAEALEAPDEAAVLRAVRVAGAWQANPLLAPWAGRG